MDCLAGPAIEELQKSTLGDLLDEASNKPGKPIGEAQPADPKPDDRQLGTDPMPQPS